MLGTIVKRREVRNVEAAEACEEEKREKKRDWVKSSKSERRFGKRKEQHSLCETEGTTGTQQNPNGLRQSRWNPLFYLTRTKKKYLENTSSLLINSSKKRKMQW